MSFDLTLFTSTFVTLTVILDPPGAIPIFLALTGPLTAKQKVAAARRASLVALGVIASFAVISFLGAWNQYLWPQRITNDPDYRTVQIGLRSLSSANPDRLNLITAGTVIAAVPIVIVLIIFQRQLIRGLTAGAVKG